MFHFKQFSIRQQPGAGMKVGTDGVLLGAWARVEPSMTRLLDAGTGTGVIALMLAQRTARRGARIDALDIDEESCRQALENALDSPWGERITVIHSSLQAHATTWPHTSIGALRDWASRPAVYDHIVSNPPYFSSALRPEEPARLTARHTVALPPQELIESVDRLLAREGLFSVILPVDQARELRTHAVARDLLLGRMTQVSTRAGAAPRRVLMEFSRTLQRPLTTDSLVIGDERYGALTNDFYL